MACGEFKDLNRRTAADKVLHNHLILIKIRHMMDIKTDLIQRFTIFLIKNLLVVALKMRMFQTNNYLENYKNQL